MDSRLRGNDVNVEYFYPYFRASCKSMSCGSTGSPWTGKVVRQAHHEWINQDTVTLSRELAKRSKGVFGVLQEALSIWILACAGMTARGHKFLFCKKLYIFRSWWACRNIFRSWWACRNIFRSWWACRNPFVVSLSNHERKISRR